MYINAQHEHSVVFTWQGFGHGLGAAGTASVRRPGTDPI